ncbi:hypothetical protein [Asticcacaulis benevestitus]|uniref:Uncharacterized protein n=1 Tax=Asticcacaulis benevestitus DSM 16100 = ATCC BAA-896 TaxID=1121022 RepID=V4PZ99_9CAUL|nr:hypothetical protein [Asticcacaulis benevestitus]ESQ93691.1 hypothetical protein ABENE_05065 [Asticcacaulis benevestitus DSM 16100 = ATCC BAA-896]
MSKTFTATLFAFSCLTLIGCDGHKADGGSARRDFAPDPASAFDASFEITPAALARMKAQGTNLVLDVSYYGYPTEAARPKANQLRQIDLGQEKVVANLATPKVHFLGKLDKAGLSDVTNAEAMVLLDGYSVTKVGAKDDQVTCGYYRARIDQAQAKVPVLKCDIARP